MNEKIVSFLGSRYLVWLLLAIPAWPYVSEFISPDRYYPEMMQRSGVLSVQLLVFTLSITPIAMGLKYWEKASPFGLWLLRNRRYFGLAAFAYAAIHTLLYLRQISFDVSLAWLEALDWPFGSGWIALIVISVIAATSNNWSVRRLRRRWKTIQRYSYLVAIAAFAHWLLLDFFIDDAMQWIIPLVIAKVFHVIMKVRKSELLENSKSRKKTLYN